MTLGELLDAVRDALLNADVEDSGTIAAWIVSDVAALPYSGLSSNRSRALSTATCDGAMIMVQRCINGEPIQYVVGYTEFFNCRIQVGPGVLVPRPETEELVERALMRWKGGSVLDLCTGSGCIPLAMAMERPTSGNLLGVDVSTDALAWANKNKEALGIHSVRFMISDLFDVLPNRQFELITANPPYVNPSVRDSLDARVVEHEPEDALFADDCGTAIIRRIIEQAPDHLIPQGWLIMEIGHDQGTYAADLMRSVGFEEVGTIKDLSGHDRIIEGRRR